MGIPGQTRTSRLAQLRGSVSCSSNRSVADMVPDAIATVAVDVTVVACGERGFLPAPVGTGDRFPASSSGTIRAPDDLEYADPAE